MALQGVNPGHRLLCARFDFADDPGWPKYCAAGPRCHLAILGCQHSVPSVEAGMPPKVVDVLAEALTATGWVIFPSSAPAFRSRERVWQPSEKGWYCRLRPSWAAYLRGERTLFLRATRSTREARMAFDDSRHPWALEAQRVLSLPADLPLPRLDHRFMAALFAPSVAREPLDALGELGVQGVLAPGPDGDFVQCVGLNPRWLEEMEQQLARASEKQGVTWAMVDAATFNTTQWAALPASS